MLSVADVADDRLQIVELAGRHRAAVRNDAHENLQHVIAGDRVVGRQEGLRQRGQVGVLQVQEVRADGHRLLLLTAPLVAVTVTVRFPAGAVYTAATGDPAGRALQLTAVEPLMALPN